MVTAAQIAANRRNALKSTGPRTAAGKSASSRNALRHGLAAQAAVVRGEDPADFERFRAELRQALAPRNWREEGLAETAVDAAWRMRRAWRAEAALFNRQGRLYLAPSGFRALLILQRYEMSAHRRFHRAIAMLERGRTLVERKRLTARSRSRRGCHARACRYMSRASRNRSTAAATARNRRLRATNPISRPCTDSQPLGVVRVWSSHRSRLAFAENRLSSWKSARKTRQTAKNSFESAPAWPPFVGGRRAPPHHPQPIALS